MESGTGFRYPVQVLFAALRIAYESFRYRVEKHEANNLLATLSMLLAFEVGGLDLALRVVFAILLNFLIYLLNDYCDLEVDLRDCHKNQPKTRFMADHRRASQLAVVGEMLILGGVALAHYLLFDTVLLAAALVINVALYHAYSRWLKRIPIVDVLSMTLAGATSTMVGAPGSLVGYRLLGLLAMFSGAYEAIQVIRDVESDEQQGVHTTAVFLGPRLTAWLFRAIVLGAALYGVLYIGCWTAAGLTLALLLPLGVEQAARSWDKARIVFGLVWIGLLVELSLGL